MKPFHFFLRLSFGLLHPNKNCVCLFWWFLKFSKRTEVTGVILTKYIFSYHRKSQILLESTLLRADLETDNVGILYLDLQLGTLLQNSAAYRTSSVNFYILKINICIVFYICNTLLFVYLFLHCPRKKFLCWIFQDVNVLRSIWT